MLKSLKFSFLKAFLALFLTVALASGVYGIVSGQDEASSASSSPSAYLVKPYLVYPADKPMYPKYETAVRNYMVELQSWYLEKVGVTFNMAPLQVIRSSYSYDIMRCDPNPQDTIPPSAACLNDPKRIDGNWGYYMNTAIHGGIESWDEQTATLVFSAGGGGFAGADKYPNDAGWAISGDWVLEPISGRANSWGIPCSYSDGWQCSGGVPKGTPAHELAHAFGLPHPDEILYPGEHVSIMRWHGDYPTVGFLPHEIQLLRQSPFFQSSPTPTPTPSPTPTPAPSKRVFVTSTAYNGNLGGLSGADAKCQTRANAVSLGGVWKAWLSDSTISASSRLTHSTSDYKLLNNVIVANGWTDLTDGTLDNKINRTETGTTVSNNAWTNTKTNGTIDTTNNNCTNWTVSTLSQKGERGATSSTISTWTDNGNRTCDGSIRLYCLEQ